MMEEFSKLRYKVDVLKVEVPANMKYVDTFGDSEAGIYKKGGVTLFQRASDAAKIPFIFLSAGV